MVEKLWTERDWYIDLVKGFVGQLYHSVHFVLQNSELCGWTFSDLPCFHYFFIQILYCRVFLLYFPYVRICNVEIFGRLSLGP